MDIDYKALGIKEEDYLSLLKQCQEEVNLSYDFMLPKWESWGKRLKLLNNQRKDETTIGDTTAHVHFNTIHAALYDDEINTTFLPRSQGDEVQTQNLNPLYEYDCEIMEKEKLNYKWIWNTLFFSRSLVGMFEFDREMMVPKPHLINMMTWYRDPNALSVNGDSSGHGAMRFGGFPTLFTLHELETAGIYANLEGLVMDSSNNEPLRRSMQEVKLAQGFGGEGVDNGLTNKQSRQGVVMDWLTIFEGKRVLVSLAQEQTRIIRFVELKDQTEWGIVEQTMYPNSLSWDGTSMMDLVEDKQRMKAKLINAAAFIVETNANHMYAYDMNKIHQESDLDFEMNKHVAVDGDPGNAVSPIARQQVGPELQWLMQAVDLSAQKSTGATEIQQGALSGGKKTATEIATVTDSVDTRFNLLSKVISWSEKEFARQWYKMYKLHFMDRMDEKVMSVNGANGVFFRKLKRADVITRTDPHVKVKSKLIGEAERIRKLQEFNSMFNVLTMDPSVDKNELIRMRATLGGFNEMQMNTVFKPDAERILALGENEKLEDNKFVPINENDEDMKHIQEHAKASDTKANRAHQKAHWDAHLAKNKNPNIKEELAAQQVEGEPLLGELGEGAKLGGQELGNIQSVRPA